VAQELEDQGPVQDVISYERLYRLWEANNWSATEIDFSVDKDHWENKLDDTQRISAFWNYAMFLVGEEAVARTLTPLLDAAPGFPESIFLTTQIVDEARHHVFFDRFMREVVGEGEDTESTLEAMKPHLNWGFTSIFAELDNVSDALRKKPKDVELMAQTVAIYHLVIESLLAIPGQHFIKEYCERLDILPGFASGMRHISRDESRHVAFGVKFLGELIGSSRDARAAAIEMWDKTLPMALGVFVPPNRDRKYVECFDFTVEQVMAFGLRSFEMKLGRIGIDPEEIQLLSKEDRSRSYEERAARAWALVEAGVMGDENVEPTLDPHVLEILFDGIERSVDIETARSLGGPIEWRFTDIEPWHLVVTNGHIEAKPGRAGDPALALEVDSTEFAKIAVGRSDARWAVLTRKLKVYGSLGAKAKLPKLFLQ
jgi:hypothetical protein